jgi:RsiW-degrading membrane proteinase PrsW (M82 family)
VWDQRTSQIRKVLATAVVVAIALLAYFLADENRDPEGWLVAVAVAVVGVYAGLSLARRLR